MARPTERRKTIFYMNVYQKKLFIIALFPSLAICCTFIWIGQLFYRQMMGIILFNSPSSSAQLINQWGVAISLVVFGLFVSLIYWGYYVSQNMVGAFNRIMRELDEIIEKGSLKRITVRSKDDLAQHIVNRINVLIDNIQKNKSK